VPNLINRKPRETRAEPPPDAEGPRLDPCLDLIKNRFQDRPSITPALFKTSVSILSSVRRVPRSAQGARGSIITDTTPVSESRQIGVQSVLGCVLTEVSTPTELWCHSRARRIGAHVMVTPRPSSAPSTPPGAPRAIRGLTPLRRPDTPLNRPRSNGSCIEYRDLGGQRCVRPNHARNASITSQMPGD